MPRACASRWAYLVWLGHQGGWVHPVWILPGAYRLQRCCRRGGWVCRRVPGCCHPADRGPLDDRPGRLVVLAVAEPLVEPCHLGDPLGQDEQELRDVLEHRFRVARVRLVVRACHRLPASWVVASRQAQGEVPGGLGYRLWTVLLVSVPIRFALERLAAEHCPGWVWKQSVDFEGVLVLPAVDRLMQVEELVWQGRALLVLVWQRLLGRWGVLVVPTVSTRTLQVSVAVI